MTIVDFLRARWDADQEWAERWVHPSHSTTLCGDCRLAQERVLAECEAKRRIVELHQPTPGWRHGEREALRPHCSVCDNDESSAYSFYGEGNFPCATLRLLALPYADRPGYREEWKP